MMLANLLEASPKGQTDLLDSLFKSFNGLLTSNPLREDLVVGTSRVIRGLIRSDHDSLVAHARPLVSILMMHLFTSPPTLSSFACREAAYFLLIDLCKDLVNLGVMLNEAESLAPKGRVATVWAYDPSLVKHPFQYSGIENLGTTCYMNSLMQQMFHVPSYTKAVLELKSQSNEVELLKAVQNMFSHMINNRGTAALFFLLLWWWWWWWVVCTKELKCARTY